MECIVSLGQASSELLIASGCRQRLAQRLEGKRAVVISDRHLQDAWGASLFTDLPWLVVPPGEESKSVERVSSLWSQMVRLGLDRQSVVVALGGGVVGDLAGFVAATYLRGVAFYSLPTSLLAMVDASVGGKVGIDLPEGKNLAGQFYPAHTVAVDPELLDTLPAKEFSQGMAEVIKHAILQGEPLWSLVRSFQPTHANDPEALCRLVTEAVLVKVEVVRQDPYEKTGLRAQLNLGHTYGHAIEWCADYSLGHGEAVALGLIADLRLSRALGTLEVDFEKDMLELLERWSLPTTLPTPLERFDWDRVAAALGRDKKNKDGQWCFVLPVRPGKVLTVNGPSVDLVRHAFSSLRPHGVLS